MARDWAVRANELSAEAIGNGEPTAWFDKLYAEGAAGRVTLPWNRSDPHPLLREWVERRNLTGHDGRAIVVGAGLGADAGYLASLGFRTTGFDISQTAVSLASQRYPDVTFQVADLLDLPGEWHRAFDLVVEVYTVQALPDPPRSLAIPAVGHLVAEGGTLLAVEFRDDGSDGTDAGPPFALTDTTMRLFGTDDLTVATLEALPGPLWRAEYLR